MIHKMKINFEANKFNLESTCNKRMVNNILKFTDHSWLEKTDYEYDESLKVFTAIIRRHASDTRAHNKFLGFEIWKNDIKPTIKTKVIISKFENCILHDKTEPNSLIILGSVHISEKE